MADEGWRAVMAVNLDGAFYCVREALRLMARDSIAGSIIKSPPPRRSPARGRCTT